MIFCLEKQLQNMVSAMFGETAKRPAANHFFPAKYAFVKTYVLERISFSKKICGYVCTLSRVICQILFTKCHKVQSIAM